MVEIAGATQSAAVAIIMFNRPDLTEKVVSRVCASNPAAVYLIADGPRPGVPGEDELCSQTRAIALGQPWNCGVHTLFSETNLGLRKRVSSGLDWLFSLENEAIILEDDCLADPSFFTFATELLVRYRDEGGVGVVSGNNFLRGRRVSDDSYFFTSDVRIWGWATWKRVWSDFSDNGLDYPWTRDEAEHVVSSLSATNRRNDLTVDVERSQRLDSWALPFVLHCLKRGYLNAVPEVNLVANVGFGSRSTHTKFESFIADAPSQQIEFPLRHPRDIRDTPSAGRLESAIALRRWLLFPLLHPINFLGRVVRYLRTR